MIINPSETPYVAKITVIIGLLLMAFSVNGQNEAPSGQKFSIGIKAGPSMSWLAFADNERAPNFGTAGKVGWFVAGVVQMPMKKNFSFVTEFGYAQKGRRITFNDGTWENNATYRFWEGSLLLRKSYKLEIKKDVYTRWFFDVGPNVAYWISGKGEVKTAAVSQPYELVFNQIPTSSFNYNYVNEINRWLFGIDLGLGVDATINRNQRFLFEVRYTYGQTYFGKKNSTSHIELLGFDDNLLANVKTLSLNLTYFFDFDTRKSKMGKSTHDKEVKRKRK